MTSHDNRRRAYHHHGRKRRKCRMTGKTMYRDRIEAMMVLAATRSSGASARRNECRYYPCPYCHQWHLTSQKWDPGRRNGIK